jgi:hypothetical protein
MTVFYVGDSHLGAVVNAYHVRVQQGRAPRVPTFVWLSQFERLLDRRRGDTLDRALLDAVRKAAGGGGLGEWFGRRSRRGDCTMALAIAGNDHNVLGLLNHPRRFDFVLPTEPELPLLDDHEVVPAALIEGALARLVEYPIALTKALAHALPCRVVYLQSPPPIPSAEHIARHPDEMFRAELERRGVAPPSLRLKLWKLHSAVWRRACDEAGVPILPPPPEAVDAAGFLAARAWGRDATHGNEWYGDLVISQVEACARARRDDP